MAKKRRVLKKLGKINVPKQFSSRFSAPGSKVGVDIVMTSSWVDAQWSETDIMPAGRRVSNPINLGTKIKKKIR